MFDGKTLARIADFNVLKEFSDDAVIKSLFEKCLSLTARQQAIWINEYEFDPFLAFFENYGFKRNNNIALAKELPLASVSLVKES
ncbi:hypothetical protein [Mucilaginibacter rubeus]|nr:hypothetical protein [Mucilaginibacter rubeus]QTE60499.1 hypothetical protein J3L22_17860 [Mucilaginibacter rubeus]